METMITLEQILIGERALMKLGEARGLPAKTKYWIGKLIDVASREVKNYQDLRIEALNKYGKLEEGKREYSFADGKREQFDKEIKELLAVEMPVKVVKLSFEELDAEGVDLSAVELISIEWMVNHGE